MSGSKVDHPDHYGGGDNPYEAIKVIRAWGLGFNLGNAAKYICRAGKKAGSSSVEDLEKAAWYIQDEIASARGTDVRVVPTCKPRQRRPEVGVALILRDPQGRYLFGLRKGEHGPGTWSVPGGWMEMGETPESTAVRELKEETGIGSWAISYPVPYAPCPYVSTVFGTGVHAITLYFYAELIYPQQQPRAVEEEKCERWEWFSPDVLPSPLFDPIEPERLLLGTWRP